MENTKTIFEGNVAISEFMKVKFFAYKGNHSYNKKFKTYAACEKWIKNNGLEGYYPEIFWKQGVGKYDSSWESLMPVIQKISKINAGQHPNPESQSLRRILINKRIVSPIEEMFFIVSEFCKNFNNPKYY